MNIEKCGIKKNKDGTLSFIIETKGGSRHDTTVDKDDLEFIVYTIARVYGGETMLINVMLMLQNRNQRLSIPYFLNENNKEENND